MAVLRLSSLAAAVLAALVACRPRPPAEIRIGLLATFTGPYAEVSGRPTRDGALLAVSQKGEVVVGGRRYRVRLIERDFADRGDAAASAARGLINQDSVTALVGPQFSRHAIPVAVVAEDAHVPLISPMSSNPAVTRDKRYVFRLAFLDDVQGTVLARFAARDLRARRAAVLYEISAMYSREMAERFREAFAAEGGEVVAFEPYTADRAHAIEPQLRRIARLGPDVLFLPNFTEAVGQQVRTARRLGIRAHLLGGDSWDPTLLPPLADGQQAYVTNQWRRDLPLATARRFTTAFRGAFGKEPRSTAAMTYDAVHVLLDAIGRAGSLDPDAIRDAIAATRAFTGATGVITFGGRPDPRRDVAVSRVRGGDLETVRLVRPGT